MKCSSVVEHLPSIYKALGLNPSTKRIKEQLTGVNSTQALVITFTRCFFISRLSPLSFIIFSDNLDLKEGWTEAKSEVLFLDIIATLRAYINSIFTLRWWCFCCYIWTDNIIFKVLIFVCSVFHKGMNSHIFVVLFIICLCLFTSTKFNFDFQVLMKPTATKQIESKKIHEYKLPRLLVVHYRVEKLSHICTMSICKEK